MLCYHEKGGYRKGGVISEGGFVSEKEGGCDQKGCVVCYQRGGMGMNVCQWPCIQLNKILGVLVPSPPPPPPPPFPHLKIIPMSK